MVSGFPVKIFIFGENFVGSPLFDLFGARRDDVDSLEDTDADFINEGVWSFPPIFQLHFPVICEFLRKYVLISMAG